MIADNYNLDVNTVHDQDLLFKTICDQEITEMGFSCDVI